MENTSERPGGRPRRQGAEEAVAIHLVEDAVSALQAQAVVSRFDVTFDAYEDRLSGKLLQFSENAKKIHLENFYPSKPLSALGARKLLPRFRLADYAFFRLGIFSWPRFVPSSMRSQVGRTVEHFVAFRATVFHVNYSRTPVIKCLRKVLTNFVIAGYILY